MIKRTMLILISLAALAACCGCQLAEEDKGTASNTDVLCGMFITFEYLDSDDFPENPGWNAVLNGDRPPLYDQEAGRIYAVPEDGKTSRSYVFKGIEGLRLLGVFVPGEGENEGYNTAYADDLLMDRKNGYGVTDEGTEMTLEATLYVCPEVYGSSRGLICYCNPVYQTPDGQVYMTAGSGLGADLRAGVILFLKRFRAPRKRLLMERRRAGPPQ